MAQYALWLYIRLVDIPSLSRTARLVSRQPPSSLALTESLWCKSKDLTWKNIYPLLYKQNEIWQSVQIILNPFRRFDVWWAHACKLCKFQTKILSIYWFLTSVFLLSPNPNDAISQKVFISPNWDSGHPTPWFKWFKTRPLWPQG